MNESRIELDSLQHLALLTALGAEIDTCNSNIKTCQGAGDETALASWTRFRDRAIATRKIIANAASITVVPKTPQGE